MHVKNISKKYLTNFLYSFLIILDSLGCDQIIFSEEIQTSETQELSFGGFPR